MTQPAESRCTKAALALACLAALAAPACNRAQTAAPPARPDAGAAAARANTAPAADAAAVALADAGAADAAVAAQEGTSDEGDDEAAPAPQPAPAVSLPIARLPAEEIRRGGVCAAFRRLQANAMRARLTEAEAGSARLLPQGIGACVPAGRGAWAVALESARLVRGEAQGAPPLALAGRYRVVHISADGAVHGAMPALLPCTGNDAAGRANVCVAAGRRTTRIELRPLADYDNDGEREVLVHVTEAVTDGRVSPERARVYSLRRSSVDLYSSTNRLTIRNARDVDRDRRPDLELALYTAPGPLNANDRPAGTIDGLRFVAHATDEGRFSTTDAVATRELTRLCRATPTNAARLVALDRTRAVDLAATGRNVVCARARGMTADAVSHGLREGCQGFADNVRRVRGERPAQPAQCPSWLIAWARRQPPVSLQARADSSAPARPHPTNAAHATPAAHRPRAAR